MSVATNTGLSLSITALHNLMFFILFSHHHHRFCLNSLGSPSLDQMDCPEQLVFPLMLAELCTGINSS